MQIEGVRPRDYPQELIEQLSDSQARSDMSLAFADALTKWAIDRGDIEMADAWQRKALQFLADVNPSQRNIARAEWACFELLFLGDAESARRIFSSVRPGDLALGCVRHRLMAAKHLAEGNTSAA